MHTIIQLKEKKVPQKEHKDGTERVQSENQVHKDTTFSN